MIVIAGKNTIAVNALLYLREFTDCQLKIVCNKTEDGKDGWQRSLRKVAKEIGIEEITLEQAYTQARIFLSLEFDKIVLPAKFVNTRAYNIHFSLLPKYKGMYTSVWPILQNEKETGVTLHEIDCGIDTGRIIEQIRFPIEEDDRASDLYRKYLKYGFQLFTKNIKKLIKGNINPISQEYINSTYFSKNSLDFCSIKIDLNQTAFFIKKQIMSFSFRNYQLPKVDDKIVVNAEILQTKSSLKPGTIIYSSAFYSTYSTIDFDIKIYYDRIKEIDKFSNCSIEEASELVKGLSGVHDKNEKGWSPIIVAAYHGNFDVVVFLLGLGANVNDTNYKGTTVLMYAKEFSLKTKSIKLFNFLLEQGADLKQEDNNYKNIFNYLTNDEIKLLNIEHKAIMLTDRQTDRLSSFYAARCAA